MNKITQIIPIKKEKRFFSAFIDLFLALIIGILLYEFCFFPIFQNNTDFKSKEVEANNLRSQITDLYKETRTKKFDKDNNPLDDQYLYLDFIDEFKNNEKSCIEHFYLTYAKENYDDYSENDIKWFNINILGLPREDETYNYSSFFTYKTDENDKYIYDEIGVFRNDNKFLDNINNYLDGKMYEDSSKAFQNLYSWFQSTLNKEVELLTSREPYLSLYSKYASLQNEMSNLHANSSMLSFLVSASLVYLVIPMILKKRSVGEICLSLRTIQSNNYEASYLRIFLRNFLRMITIFPFFAIIPIFKVNFVLCFTMIVYSSASFSINALTIFIISIILLAIDLCMMIYSKDGLSLVGFISKTKTIGTKPGMSETVDEDWFDQ